jgi:hypothetical protein
LQFAEPTIVFGEMAETGVSAGAEPLIRNDSPLSVLVGASSALLGDVFVRVNVRVVPEIAKLAEAVTAFPPTMALSVKMTVACAALLNASAATPAAMTKDLELNILAPIQGNFVVP